MLKGKETLWEKEKMLVTSIFSFPHVIFQKWFRQKIKLAMTGLFDIGGLINITECLDCDNSDRRYNCHG